MASLSLPRVLSHRRSGSIEVERETFWKSQTSSIGKAINQQETPVKEKHVRSAIIGTYHEKGGTTFWAVVGTLPIQENPIVCWKFCHTLHKLLREGHPNVLPESQAYRQRLRELGKYWGHLRHNFGRLISCYCRLLATKLDFHSKNPKFPGNLQLTNEQLEAIGEMDINNYFQVTVEMFDFMDEILTLQTAVFGSLETGRANSMTMSGQCRLAPLIPCIQDSSHLYDYLVKLLFKLHSSLPPDVLVGHRDRFYKQFKVLRDFYRNASILQYFKHLIQIPLLPEDPPNFLIKSEIHSHVSPVVILPPQDDSVDTDSVDMSLIDTTSPPLLEIEPTNGASSPDINSDKDRLIERLQQEIERLKREIQRIRMEDQVLIDELRHQLAAVQGKLSAQQQQLLAKNGEIELLRTKAVAAEKNVQAAEKLVEVEKKSKANEDKFQKMKDVYYKLREEHIALLRAKADVEKQLVGAKQASDTTAKSVLEQQLLEVTEQKINLEQQVADLTGNVARLESEVDSVKKDSDEGKLKSSQDKKQRQFEILVSCLEEAEDIVRNALKTVDDDSTAPLTCSPEYLLKCGGSVLETLERLKRENHSFNQDHQSDIDALLRSVTAFSHLLSQFLIEGKATFNATADIEQGTQLVKACKDSGNDTLLMLASMKIMDNAEEVETNLKKVGEDVRVACDAVESLISLSAAKVEDRIEDLVERELAEMDRAIEEAASRIAEILSKSRQAETGVKLEVSEKILDTCTALMASIRELVKRSKELQLEIVAQGKGHKSAKEFYKKNHQWTEGLLSAAKAVGMGAKFLVDAADKVVTGQAKFELLVAASQEIAASTAQLVVASKVKADPGSKNLTELSRASNTVRGCTGTVVATVKDCAQMIDDADVMDFSGLSLHQAKRLEMESQVRVLELETSLEKERVKLSTLRKRHYTLAGTGAGWEQQEEVVNN